MGRGGLTPLCWLLKSASCGGIGLLCHPVPCCCCDGGCCCAGGRCCPPKYGWLFDMTALHGGCSDIEYLPSLLDNQRKGGRRSSESDRASNRRTLSTTDSAVSTLQKSCSCRQLSTLIPLIHIQPCHHVVRKATQYRRKLQDQPTSTWFLSPRP